MNRFRLAVTAMGLCVSTALALRTTQGEPQKESSEATVSSAVESEKGASEKGIESSPARIRKSFDRTRELLDEIDSANDAGQKEKVSALVRRIRQELRQAESALKTGSEAPVAQEKDPYSVIGPKHAPEYKNQIGYGIDPDRFEGRDFWLAVQPVEASDRIWLQGSRLTAPKGSRVIFLGEKSKGKGERFEVLLLSVPRGTFKSDGPFAERDSEKHGVEIHATISLERTK